MLPGEGKHAESHLLIVEDVSLAGSMEGICTEVFLHLLLVVSVCACVCVHACMPWYSCGSQRTICQSQFFPSTIWVPEINFQSAGLVAGIFTH